jgi:hypothetical protein
MYGRKAEKGKWAATSPATTEEEEGEEDEDEDEEEEAAEVRAMSHLSRKCSQRELMAYTRKWAAVSQVPAASSDKPEHVYIQQR